MSYSVRTIFYPAMTTTNDFGERIALRGSGFVLATTPRTVSFKDRMQGEIQVDGDQQYVFARKNPLTESLKEGDFVEFPAVSDKLFRIIAIDKKLSNRRELMFLIDAVGA